MDNKLQKPNGRRARAVKSRKQNTIIRPVIRRPIKQYENTISGVRNNRDFGGAQMVYAPTAMGRTQRTRAPKIVRTSRGVRISHRELIQTVNGAIAFTAIKFACNPGIAATFPWLAPQAIQWEQYRFSKLNFEYITRTATTTVGSVLLAPDYDPSDPAPTTEAQVSTYQDVVEDVTWKDICCILKPSSMHALGPRKFIRSASVAGSDIKTYDVANFFLCVVEEVGASAIGKLWVDYDVELFVPQSNLAAGSLPTSSQTSLYSQHASESFTTATPKALAWDTLIFDPLGIGAGVAGVFTPPLGIYRIEVQTSLGDSASTETFQITIELLKNGASLASPLKSEWDNVTVLSLPRVSQTLLGIVQCSGTDTFQIQCTLTGAAGALASVADACQLLVSPA